ncbi:MAG TPA: hypothetical protein VK934_11240, partial [Fimbriimonas sp.]|nr:hypothetical protein [Fimbriimonas sp.]
MSTKLIAATLALLIAGSALSLMGGFGVSVTLPKKGDAGTEGAVLIVQPIGCHGPGASVTALAEGLDNGVRRSIPLKLHPLPGRTSAGAGEAFMVKREWPASGAWVLVFKASKDSMTANA